MNTRFHMSSITHAYAQLALTSRGTVLHARIGRQHLEIPMGSTRALAAAMQHLRYGILTPNEIVQICNGTQAGLQQTQPRPT